MHIWRLQFLRGWGRHALRTTLKNVPGAGGSAEQPDAALASHQRHEDGDSYGERAHGHGRHQPHLDSGGGRLLGHGNSGGAAWVPDSALLPDGMPSGAPTGDDSDAGGEAGDDGMLMTVPWHIGAE
jgi:hypothetical protein